MLLQFDRHCVGLSLALSSSGSAVRVASTLFGNTHSGMHLWWTLRFPQIAAVPTSAITRQLLFLPLLIALIMILWALSSL